MMKHAIPLQRMWSGGSVNGKYQELLCSDTENRSLEECGWKNVSKCVHDFGMIVVQNLLPYDRTLTPAKLLRLEMNLEQDDMEHPAVWYTAANLFHIWECRVSSMRAKLFTIRSEVESRVALLRETRFRDSAETIMQIMQ